AYWNKIQIRIQSNDTANFYFYIDHEFLAYANPSWTPTLQDGWQILEKDVSAYTNDADGVKFYFHHSSSYPCEFKIDYIRLLHQDSSLSGGYVQEFEEDSLTDGWISWGGSLTSEHGNLIFTDASTSYIELRFDFPSGTIFALDFDRFEIALSSNVDDLYFSSIKDWGYSNLYTTTHALSSDWTVINGEFGASWSGNEEGLRVVIDEDGGDGIPESSDIVYVAYFRFLSSNPPNLYETPSSYFMSSENDTLIYEVFNDYQSRGSYTDLELINLNLSVSEHSFSYVAYRDNDDLEACYLPSAFYYTEYTVTEADLCSVIIHDQSGNFIDTRQFVVTIDSTRIYGDTFLVSDISSTFSLEIEDFWGNQLYYNAAETYDRFIDLQLTLHSFKAQNLQPYPVWIELSNNGQTFSEWIFTGEIIEYKLYSATYDMKFYWSDDDTNYDVDTNGTYVEYSYTINADTAIRIAGYTISDVWGNTISLIDDLSDTNSSIHSAFYLQSENFTIQFNVIGSNISIFSENMNLNFTAVNASIISILADYMSLNFSVTNSLINLMSNYMLGNFSFTNSLVNFLESAMVGNFSFVNNQIEIVNSMLQLLNVSMSGNFSFTNNLINLIESSMNGNFSFTNNLVNLLDSAMFGNFSFLNNNFEGNFTFTNSLIMLLNTSMHGNISFYGQTIIDLVNILDSNVAGNFSVELAFLDLSNSTQVNLLIENFNQILLAQEYAAEYMSILRYESSPTFVPLSASTAQIKYSTNWQNTTSTLYRNGSLIFSSLAESDLTTFNLPSTEGLYNFTLVVSAGDICTFYYRVLPAETLLVQTAFSFTSELGTGKVWETARLLVNNSRVAYPIAYYANGTVLNISLTDWAGRTFNFSLPGENFSRTFYLVQVIYDTGNIFEIPLVLPLREYTFYSEQQVALRVTLQAYNYSKSFDLAAVQGVNISQAITLELFAGVYNITVSPILTEYLFSNGTHYLIYSNSTSVTTLLKDGISTISVACGFLANKITRADSETFVDFLVGFLTSFGMSEETALALLSILAIVIPAMIVMLLAKFGVAAVIKSWNVAPAKVVGKKIKDPSGIQVEDERTIWRGK
ncbi:MAG: hypothetical protein ACTSYA_01885, partial [Candidatus Kariarchaeaceae archaeon]